MRVNLEFLTTDADGQKSSVNTAAILRREENGYLLSFAEVLSDGGAVTKTTLLVGEKHMRLARGGEIETVFLFEDGLLHHTYYKTPYGSFPAEVLTKSYRRVCREGVDGMPESLFAEVHYALTLSGGEPMGLSVEIRVKR